MIALVYFVHRLDFINGTIFNYVHLWHAVIPSTNGFSGVHYVSEHICIISPVGYGET